MRKYKYIQKIINSTKFKSKNDPLGSYTGNALDGAIPIQDADDL